MSKGNIRAQLARRRARKRGIHVPAGASVNSIRKRAQRRSQTRQKEAMRFHDKPVVTIFADASFFARKKSGSWGVWIKADGRPAIVKGGPFLGEIESSVEAEMRALANALALARAAGVTPDGCCVMVQSDCQAALSWVLGAVKTSCHRPAPDGVHVDPALRVQKALAGSPGLRKFVDVAKAAKLKIVVRHVRGHQEGGDGRHWVNRLVDEVAKQHRLHPAEEN